MASDNADALEDRQKESYVDTGVETSCEVTTSATPNLVTTITLPASTKGFKLFPRSNAIRFAVNRDTVTVATSTATSIVAASVFTAGGIAKADMWEVRLLPSVATRTLRLSSATASVVVDVELF